MGSDKRLGLDVHRHSHDGEGLCHRSSLMLPLPVLHSLAIADLFSALVNVALSRMFNKRNPPCHSLLLLAISFNKLHLRVIRSIACIRNLILFIAG